MQYEDEKEYQIALIKYYITIVLFNLITILTLSGVAYLVGCFTFLVIGAVITNSLRAYIPNAYHCDRLWKCVILTNTIFLIGALTTHYGLVSPILAYVGSLTLMVILYHQHTTKAIWVNLVLCALTFAIGTKEIKDAVFMALFFVFILQREVGELDG